MIWFCKKGITSFLLLQNKRNGLKYLSIYAKYVLITVLIFMKQINRLNGLNNSTIKQYFHENPIQNQYFQITCRSVATFFHRSCHPLRSFVEAKLFGAPWKVGRRTATRTCRVGGLNAFFELFFWSVFFFSFFYLNHFFEFIFFKFDLPKIHP